MNTSLFCRHTFPCVIIFGILGAQGVTAAPDKGAAALDVRRSRATGVARFVTARGGGAIEIPLPAGRQQAQPADFFEAYGRLFAITDPAGQLRLGQASTDNLGRTHTTYHQMHDGVPVFAGVIRVHTDNAGQITAVNGTFVPNIHLDVNPRLSADVAERTAIAHVVDQLTTPVELEAVNTELQVFRTNLARGISGIDHLVYEVEVGNGANVREFVYVDAHKGDVVDQITGICDSVNRIVYDQFVDAGTLLWSEGDSTPYGDTEVDNIIDNSLDAYNLFASATNGSYLSWDGFDSSMLAVNNDQSLSCPNAHWTGWFTGFCLGITGDDVVTHEWTHAYTERTHGLIYAWQPGALNESYSDIMGETADLINGRGSDSPNVPRTAGDCSIYARSPSPGLTVNSPGGIAGAYNAEGAWFNPSPPASVTADVELVNDGDDEGGDGSITDGCQPLIGFTPGNIALIDRGTCFFDVKAINAQNAGAVGMILVNVDPVTFWMGGSGNAPTIPSLMVKSTDGALIKTELPGVSATMTFDAPTANSFRWLNGEDCPAFGGAIRDAWNPTCFNDPGRVLDPVHYWCDSGDGGGVHSNSGIPNHGFALLVDGGTYNGQTIAGIGHTKAFHIYWRAQTVYQVPITNFADHADALEQSCADLVGINLWDVSTSSATGTLSGQIITSSDCAEVAKMVAAVELRAEPTFCGYDTMLDPAEPDSCNASQVASAIYEEDWEGGLGAWTVGTRALANPPAFDIPDWAVVTDLPDGRAGSAAFVSDPISGDCGISTNAGVLYLESPSIAIPSSALNPRLSFTHWAATERRWDGGNVKISVNGGGFVQVPGSAFLFNPYSLTMELSDNPMGGEEAFSGSDAGSVRGSWGTSLVDLSGLAPAGSSIRLRFEMGQDGCNGRHGWYVDDVALLNCVDIVEPATVAPTPHNRPKNRYLSFDPGNPGVTVAFEVRYDDGTRADAPLGWVGPPAPGTNVARVVDLANRHLSDAWPAVVHVGDCEVSPDRDYSIVATLPDGTQAAALVVSSTPAPGSGVFWADCVGPFSFVCTGSYQCCDPNPDCPGAVCPAGEACEQQWAPPEGATNFGDVQAAIRKFQEVGVTADITWVDLHGAEGAAQNAFFDPPNGIVNFSDVQQIIKAYQGDEYPYSSPDGCP